MSWRRSAIEVEPRGGFRPNTTYRITLLPGLADLRGNVRKAPTEIVFSTGATIPAGRIAGAVFDWGAGRAAPLAMVHAFRASDSTLRWVARADSSGRYALRDLAPGPYTVRAYLDANTNRRLDDREAFDSMTVIVAAEAADTATTDFYTFVHDTIGPRIEVVDAIDSVALRVRFDRPVAVDWVPDSTRAFVLQRADSSVVPLGAILPAARLDSILDAERARADSVRRAADTTAARDTNAAARRPVPLGARRDTTDSLARRLPQMRRPIPVQTWAVRLPAPLPPGTYRFRAVEIPGLSGRRRSSEREFRIREPVRADSTAPPRPPQR